MVWRFLRASACVPLASKRKRVPDSPSIIDRVSVDARLLNDAVARFGWLSTVAGSGWFARHSSYGRRAVLASRSAHRRCVVWSGWRAVHISLYPRPGTQNMWFNLSQVIVTQRVRCTVAPRIVSLPPTATMSSDKLAALLAPVAITVVKSPSPQYRLASS